MRTKGFICGILFVALAVVSVPAQAADNYVIDAMHSAVTFKISHMGLSWVAGRFNSFSGSFAIDPGNPAASSFELNIKPESVDTAQAKRDEHLRGPDFFNVKQFPALSFKSTAVKAAENGLEVTGDLTLHGTTKSVTFILQGGRKAEFPKGVQRTGYTTELSIKRSAFGMDKMLEAIGDEVFITISFQGIKK
jgi:polyisoprenoid-binding protein YceI